MWPRPAKEGDCGKAGYLLGISPAWLSMDPLPLFGPDPVDERVVIDRNCITGGGITTGIDFGLHVAAALRGERAAQKIQLMMEYNPQPPFEDRVASLHPKGHAGKISGLAVETSVGESGGAFEVVTNWSCSADNALRDYHLAVGTDTLRATEYFPQEEWRMNELGNTSITAGTAHLLRIESSSGTVEFFVDGRKIVLQSQPSLSSCFEISDWALDFYVWKNRNQVEGYITSVSTR